MKKNSKSQKKNYDNTSYEELAYYGVLMKNGRSRIDTKRFKKFFTLPNNKIERRTTQYYLPTKIHKFDYICNYVDEVIKEIKDSWHVEYKKMIDSIKTPKEVESKVYMNICDGIMDYDEVGIMAKVKKEERRIEYKRIKKTIYSQYFSYAMSKIEAMSINILKRIGFNKSSFSRMQFDDYIQGYLYGLKKTSISFREYQNYKYYDKAYKVWNFLKHNSRSAYEQLNEAYPECIYDPDNSYTTGELAITVLKISEEFILKLIDNIKLFFNELCEIVFGENIEDAKWDYDDYFIYIANDQIELMLNPLGLPWYI